ncbi:M48 family metallopeptidase [Aeromonas schubertii]|uniref:M48 family metallopeptidase n=1 Tax=Aeromonas schubertii TaxID=652 RepID=UPI00067EA4D2|nr:M48 family metallopeptidase [Aeromonas schubertii]KUE80543.1 hypothetical protein ATO46_16370 [Aeromonas schubertii]
MEIPGHLLPPGESVRHPARLRVEGDGTLQLDSFGYCYRGHLDEVVVGEALGSVPRTLTDPHGWCFVPRDGALMARLLEAHHGRGRLARWEQRGSLLALALVVVVLLGFKLLALPSVSGALVRLLPPALMSEVGERGYQALLKSHQLQPSRLHKTQQAQLQARFAALSATLALPRPAPRLTFHHMNESIAFILPDGRLVMSDAMVKRVDNEAEMEALWLHELGHHHYRHGMTRLVSAGLWGVIATLVVGNVSGAADSLASLSWVLMDLGYSRDLERAADGYAIRQLVARHGSSEALATLLRRLGKEQGARWLSTHPSMAERIAAAGAAP